MVPCVEAGVVSGLSWNLIGFTLVDLGLASADLGLTWSLGGGVICLEEYFEFGIGFAYVYNCLLNRCLIALGVRSWDPVLPSTIGTRGTVVGRG